MAETFPSVPGFLSSSFYLETNTRTYTSPFSKVVQREIVSGGRWRAVYSLPPMMREQASKWQSFLLKLEGMKNTFNGGDPEGKAPRGSGLGAPQVNGADQTGSSLETNGWNSDEDGLLLEGDYFSVNGELKQVTSPVSSDGSGNATINFKPELRESPEDAATVTINNPTCEMILMSDISSAFVTDKNGVYQSLSFQCVEAIV